MTTLEQFVEDAHNRMSDVERESLWKRGVTDEQIALYKIGYIEDPSLLGPMEGNLREFLQKKARNSFVLPLTNTLGKVRGFQLRSADRQTKGYSDYIEAKDEAVSFGLHQAIREIWQTGKVWLVEGAFDLFPIQRVYTNVVSTITNGIPELLGKVLRRLVEEVWVAYDADRGGNIGRSSIRKQYGDVFRLHEVSFPLVKRAGVRVKDPEELWLAWGDERLGVWLKEQGSLL